MANLVPLLILLLSLVHHISASYSVNSSACRIPDIDPFEEDAVVFFESHKKIRCRKGPEVISLSTDNASRVSLRVNKSEALKFKIFRPECCLQVAERKSDDNNYRWDTLKVY